MHNRREQRKRVSRQYLEIHRTANWTLVICVALGMLVCFMLVAFHVGRRCSGKNHDIEGKIPKKTMETALRCKKAHEAMMKMVRNRNVSAVAKLLIRWKIPRYLLTKCSTVGTERVPRVVRDWKVIVDTTANSRRKVQLVLRSLTASRMESTYELASGSGIS